MLSVFDWYSVKCTPLTWVWKVKGGIFCWPCGARHRAPFSCRHYAVLARHVELSWNALLKNMSYTSDLLVIGRVLTAEMVVLFGYTDE